MCGAGRGGGSSLQGFLISPGVVSVDSSWFRMVSQTCIPDRFSLGPESLTLTPSLYCHGQKFTNLPHSFPFVLSSVLSLISQQSVTKDGRLSADHKIEE